MDIAEFVEATLQQIVDGVSRAQKSTHLAGNPGPEGDLINPALLHHADSAPKGKYYVTMGMGRTLVHFVQFDVAVTTEAADAVAGGGKIRVLGIGAGAAGSMSSKETVASRVKFEVPIALPRSKTDAG
jgi:hypothetical protein